MKFYNLWRDCGKDYMYFELFSIDYDLENKRGQVILFNFQVTFVWGN